MPDPATLDPVAAEIYAMLRPMMVDDEANGYVGAALARALGAMLQAVADLARDRDEQVLTPDGRTVTMRRAGWSIATDVDLAPGAGSEIDTLPFLGMLAGVQGIEPLSDTDRRAAIRDREAFHRGRPAAIISFASRYTDGAPGAVQIRERYNPALGSGVDAPGYGRVIIKRSRLLPGVDTVDMTRRILARYPAGRIVDVLITDERDFDEVRSTFRDFDDVNARNRDFNDLLDG